MKIHQHRKNEHLSLAEKFFKTQSSNQLDEVQLIYSNLPELNLSDIDIRSTLVGKDIPVPFFINAITGGSPQTDDINYKLATVAAKANIPMACGSQSIALKYPPPAPEVFAAPPNFSAEVISLVSRGVSISTELKLAKFRSNSRLYINDS